MCGRIVSPRLSVFFFFFNDTATTEIYTLSLHDALPISEQLERVTRSCQTVATERRRGAASPRGETVRSEEHTSELQSRLHLVCRLLLEKKKIQYLHALPPDGLVPHRASRHARPAARVRS